MPFLRWILKIYIAHIRSYDTKTLELVLASVSIMWGGWVLNPFSNSLSSPTFAPVMDYVPEWFVGIVFAALGILRLYAIYRDSNTWRSRVAAAGYHIWFLMTVLTLMGGERAFAPFFLSFTLMSVNIAVRTWRKTGG